MKHNETDISFDKVQINRTELTECLKIGLFSCINQIREHLDNTSDSVSKGTELPYNSEVVVALAKDFGMLQKTLRAVEATKNREHFSFVE